MGIPQRVGIVMEFVPNNLRNAIENDSSLREIDNQLKIAKQISSGMNFLHSLTPPILVSSKFSLFLKILILFILKHRDLRSPNILINEKLECKITDFGISNNLGYKEIENKNLYTSLIPPETREKGIFTKESDVYFFGWVLFELFLGRKYENEFDINQIVQALNKEQNDHRKKGFQILIIKCLQNVNS